jgi:hypothetical protein
MECEQTKWLDSGISEEGNIIGPLLVKTTILNRGRNRSNPEEIKNYFRSSFIVQNIKNSNI